MRCRARARGHLPQSGWSTRLHRRSRVDEIENDGAILGKLLEVCFQAPPLLKILDVFQHHAAQGYPWRRQCRYKTESEANQPVAAFSALDAALVHAQPVGALLQNLPPLLPQRIRPCHMSSPMSFSDLEVVTDEVTSRLGIEPHGDHTQRQEVKRRVEGLEGVQWQANRA